VLTEKIAAPGPAHRMGKHLANVLESCARRGNQVVLDPQAYLLVDEHIALQEQIKMHSYRPGQGVSTGITAAAAWRESSASKTSMDVTHASTPAFGNNCNAA